MTNEMERLKTPAGRWERAQSPQRIALKAGGQRARAEQRLPGSRSTREPYMHALPTRKVHFPGAVCSAEDRAELPFHSGSWGSQPSQADAPPDRKRVEDFSMGNNPPRKGLPESASGVPTVKVSPLPTMKATGQQGLPHIQIFRVLLLSFNRSQRSSDYAWNALQHETKTNTNGKKREEKQPDNEGSRKQTSNSIRHMRADAASSETRSAGYE